MSNEILASDHISLQGVQTEHHTINGIQILSSIFRPVIVKGATNMADADLRSKTGKP